MRPPDVHQRLERIEETMATREDVAELRAGIARLRSPWRGVAVTVPVAALVIGFMVPVLAFAVRPGIAS